MNREFLESRYDPHTVEYLLTLPKGTLFDVLTVENPDIIGSKVPLSSFPGFQTIATMMREEEEYTVVVAPGEYICARCGSNHIRTINRQLRSSDEGDTTIFDCTKCNFVWKRNN